MRFLLLVMALLYANEAQAQTQWDHNGSTVALYANGAERQFTYVSPRAGLPIGAGTLLFKGKGSGDSYGGTAFVFSSRCGTRGYQVTGVVSNNDETVTLFGKAPLVDENCRVADYRDDVLVFNLIHPDESPNVSVSTYAAPEAAVGPPQRVCVVPEFTEEQRLMSQIDGTDATTFRVAQAIVYLRARYCVFVKAAPASASRTYLSDGSGCAQDSGYYFGELVYWGECHE